MKKITLKQLKVLDAITAYSAENNGAMPTYRELMKILSIKWIKSIQMHVGALIKKGYIEKKFHKSRGLVVKKGLPRMKKCNECWVGVITDKHAMLKKYVFAGCYSSLSKLDRRRLIQFGWCPECGRKINWKKIKGERCS